MSRCLRGRGDGQRMGKVSVAGEMDGVTDGRCLCREKWTTRGVFQGRSEAQPRTVFCSGINGQEMGGSFVEGHELKEKRD